MAKTLEQMRQATQHLAAYVWEAAGHPDRVAAARRGVSDASEEYAAAVSTLDDAQRRRLQAGVEFALASLQNGRRPT